MKKKIAIVFMLVISFVLTACSVQIEKRNGDTVDQQVLETQTETETATEEDTVEIINEPELNQVHMICELATEKVYLHNVGSGEKSKGDGLQSLGKKDRKYFIEYSTTAKIGIDMSRVSMTVDGTNITIEIPPAEVLSMGNAEYSPDDIYTSENGIRENLITNDEQNESLAEAKEKLIKELEENDSLMYAAQNRAIQLIENYINQLGEASGVNYRITWVYLDSDKSDTTTDAETETETTQQTE